MGVHQAQTTQPSDFIIDPTRDGIANALWFAASGTLAVNAGKFRFNTDDAIVRADLLHATVDFSVRFPTTGVQTPTNLANDVAFGLKNLSLGNLGKIDVFVDQSANSIVFRTYDDFGAVETTTLTWNTAWNSAQTIFRISWAGNHVSLSVMVSGATSFAHLAKHEMSVPSRPLNPFFNVVGADNVDVDFISVKNAQHSSIMLI